MRWGEAFDQSLGLEPESPAIGIYLQEVGEVEGKVLYHQIIQLKKELGTWHLDKGMQQLRIPKAESSSRLYSSIPVDHSSI